MTQVSPRNDFEANNMSEHIALKKGTRISSTPPNML